MRKVIPVFTAMVGLILVSCGGGNVSPDGSAPQANIFTKNGVIAPFDCTVFVKPAGGTAGAKSELGLGTSLDNFQAIVHGLPESADFFGPSVLGEFKKGEKIPLAMVTSWGGLHFASASGDDEASLGAFTDTDGSLAREGRKVVERTEDGFLLHLDDAASFTVDDNDGDILVEIWFEPLEK